VVVIIRGGGAQSDLHCFNSYWLTSHICQFPLPVLTGIGHEQDETIADLVAHTRLKTPTAVAEFLIDCYRQADEAIHERSLLLSDMVTEKVEREKELLKRMYLLIKPAIKEKLAFYSGNLRISGLTLKGSVKQLHIKNSGTLNTREKHLKTLVKEFLTARKLEIDGFERMKDYLDPFLILKRGYSVTYHNGKALKNADIPKDEVVVTRLAEGILKSKIL
jgi:exodeoxyribonuclease VII large subunit